MRIKTKINLNWEYGRVEILLYQPDFEGEIKAVGLPVDNFIFKDIEAGEFLKPTFVLQKETLQSLIDECYIHLGMIPSDLKNKYKYDDKVLEKVENHLQDMRKLVFKNENNCL